MSGHSSKATRPVIDEAKIFADLERRRLCLAPALEPGTDVSAWPPDRLREAHLPPAPHPTATLASSFWVKAVANLELVPPRPLREFFKIDHTARHAVHHQTTGAASHNWSGAVVGIPDHWSCQTLQAEWRVPTAKPGVPANPPPNTPWQGSCWIGLDGDIPGSVTLPQLGSTHGADRQTGAATANLWWQWWIQGDPNSAPIVFPIPTKPHDRIMAILTVLSPICVNFFIKNLATNLAVAFDIDAPSLPALPPVPIEQQTMEWIVERQTEIGGVDLLPFADYGACHFDACSATMLDAAGNAVAMDLTDPVTLQMQDWTNQQNPGTIISTYDDGNATTVKVRYLP